MNIGDRIKKVRKDLDMTQAEFARRIGSVQNTITGYESGRRNPSAPVISLICKEFNVNEEWLRTGKGEMFNPAPTNALEQLAHEYGLSNAAYIMIEKFVNLQPEKRRELIDFFTEVSKAITESNAAPDDTYSEFSETLTVQALKEIREQIPKTPEELEKQFPPVESDKKKPRVG